MLKNMFKLEWEWCVAHMLHAATKAACGMNGDVNTSLNPEMTKLISAMNKTVYQVRTIEKTGDLFRSLCRAFTETASVRLVDYSASRFLGLTASILRILEKWPALERWYEARVDQARRKREVSPVFPLAGRHEDLAHILSVLKDIVIIKKWCQAEKPNQVEILMALYKTRLEVLEPRGPVKHYTFTRTNPVWINPNDLTPLASRTRDLLRKALDQRFFSRYTDVNAIRSASYVFEMQQRLHPSFKVPEKSINRVIRICTLQRAARVAQHQVGDAVTAQSQQQASMRDAVANVKLVEDKIVRSLRELMTALADPGDARDDAQQPPSLLPILDEYTTEGYSLSFSEELVETFAAPRQPILVESRLSQRIDEELCRWMDDPAQLTKSQFGKENVLKGWKRMESLGNYRILPKVARVLFSAPASSAMIERDFSVSGAMVTAQRASLSSAKVDMCSFLNRNRDFVDISQCPTIPRSELQAHIPQSMTFALGSVDDTEFVETMIAETFAEDSDDEEDDGMGEEEETKSEE